MKDENSSFLQDVENKFLEGFSDTVPTETLLPAKTDHSIGNSVLADLPHTAEAKHLSQRIRRRHHRTRRRHSEELLMLFIGSFFRAVFYGIGIGIFFNIMNTNIEEWYPNHLPSQSTIILLTILFVFSFGLITRFGSLLRSNYF